MVEGPKKCEKKPTKQKKSKKFKVPKKVKKCKNRVSECKKRLKTMQKPLKSHNVGNNQTLLPMDRPTDEVTYRVASHATKNRE